VRRFGDAESAGRPAPGTGAGRKGLKNDALGMFSSVVIGLASTAPAYSLAATLGFIVAAVGLQAPIVTMVAFIPMLLIAYAFRELNASNADCGTTSTWATRAFGPRTGWMGGWGVIVADVIVMTNLAQIAGTYSFRLVGLDGLAEDRLWTTVAGIVTIRQKSRARAYSGSVLPTARWACATASRRILRSRKQWQSSPMSSASSK